MNANLVGSYFKRAVKLYPDFVLGTGNESFSKALKETVKIEKPQIKVILNQFGLV